MPTSRPIALQIARPIYVPLATLLLVVVLGSWLASTVKDFDPMIAAQNKRVRFIDKEQLIAGGPLGLTPDEAKKLQAVADSDATANDSQPWLLYVGNSQTLMVSDPGPGDMTSAQWLELLSERKYRRPVTVRLGGLGGMVMPEILLRTVSMAETRRKPDAVIVALLLDEFREVGVRPEIAKLAADPGMRSALQDLLVKNPDLTDAAQALAPVLKRGTDTGADPAKPIAVRVEDRLQSSADEHWSLFERRPTLVAQTFVAFLKWRNRIFHITSANVRPVRAPMFKANFELLEMLLRYARERGIPVVLYLAPVRHAGFSPDAQPDLDRLHHDATELGRKYGIVCADYMELLPEGLWTNYASGGVNERAGLEGQRDFAHFTGGGHRLLGERLASDFADLLFRTPPREVRR